LQASEQMLYDVYENTIGMIEELEKYEDHGKSAGFSGLLRDRVPPTRKREKHDVTAIIEGQLVALDGQMTYAPPDVTKQARMKMLDRTLLWVAAREEKEIPLGLADSYAKSLVQLLTEPESMKLPERERPSDPRSGRLDEAAVNNFLCRYAEARHQGEQQDKEFYDHPNKKAAMRDMRHGRDHHNGIRRLLNLNRNDERFREVLTKQGKDAMDIN